MKQHCDTALASLQERKRCLKDELKAEFKEALAAEKDKGVLIALDKIQLRTRLVVEARYEAHRRVAVVRMAQRRIFHLHQVDRSDAATRHFVQIKIKRQGIGEVESQIRVMAPPPLREVAHQVGPSLTGDA